MKQTLNTLNLTTGARENAKHEILNTQILTSVIFETPHWVLFLNVKYSGHFQILF